ncbi:MAG: hypothetical protein A3J09_00705 [Candidatus Zambryskibacteria bacterium RIFCSPLOWO2_02_FULL_51_21]|uniref:pyruvate kinase n=1 Tax=Candidatus Zambryskibacteria bacterium RIFCSPHIGHO2_02_FULL_43_37 TaxID=1802749 RepID=A0A1G2TJC5_9BACT|nr:MAG: hypothetical protein A2723_00700 [Candidatus Zambryskibacteria bacterium RIFCSPHIGHO2_01_FULL_52_18]OHA96721.1 MAG: hypothetical protein A3D49_02665 [Candidatus Zambryskibacteria bacterium RIFCSPHIGHO2_02_FULL_43_37]OHB07414.1 MAG: hypothetical protein A2944_01740 [Candidatus Zambryskibacteria bacterium RIFCSPLOWO2_01_FULL_52_12]OHB11076.1 MAG: hypothetical protein A3J09_00705 [Candidatus Zambryskibacteria bacterium RIFCSPLOWO2_02_FULL_51_21]
MSQKNSKAQIIVTIGPASEDLPVLEEMLSHQMDVVRFNFAWSDFREREKQMAIIRELEKKSGKKIPIIQDLPGPRRTGVNGHSYDLSAADVLSLQDKSSIAFGAEHGLDWIALSFVGSAAEVEACREEVKRVSGKQKIMAKIERQAALDNLDAIIASSDAVMVARGDLGNEVPIESIPFLQAEIIRKCKTAGKPVVVATEMLLSMVKNDRPTRAEVTDVANAIIQGSDAVMLSEETSIGAHPVEAVAVMEKILAESERHLPAGNTLNPL